MGKLPDYKFVPEADSKVDETCPIEILSGQHAGIVYRYGVIRVAEHDNDNVKVIMDIDIIKAPEGFNKDTESFTMDVGEIFVNIVENQSQKEVPVDLEDDVHQD